MKRDFAKWLSTFRTSIASYEYYVDFEKVYDNIDAIRIELNILNSLVGSRDIENDFRQLLERYPEVLRVIPILLAKRESEIYCQDENGGRVFVFKANLPSFKSRECFAQYAHFMKKTGLFDLISNRIINNLVDYVTGVEVGLDSNGRKNRGGHLMEDLVEGFLKKEGLVKDIHYFKEMYISDIEKRWHIDLSGISNQGKTEKRFDFVVRKGNMIYGIETNFYTGGGSKLNETARSYKTIALEARGIEGFAFVWVTDGQGWHSARNNLEETFDVMENIYCIHDLESGILNTLFAE